MLAVVILRIIAFLIILVNIDNYISGTSRSDSSSNNKKISISTVRDEYKARKNYRRLFDSLKRTRRTRTRSKKPQLIPKPSIQNYLVDANIKYRFATTVVSSTVVNPANIGQEVNFLVTLPESAFISQFLMIIKNETYKAHVSEKMEAEDEYNRAKQTGQTAGHVQLNDRDSNRFTVCVNVEAKDNVVFNLTYEQLLQRTLGFYENKIVVNPGQVVDNLNVNVNIEESVSLATLEVADSKTTDGVKKLKQLTNITINRPTDKTAQIRWNPSRTEQEKIVEELNTFFVVRYDVDRRKKSNQILVGKSHFAHFIAPGNLTGLGKHMLFVLDVSGSMKGSRLNQVKTAMKKILAEINVDDYFSLILFSRNIYIWSPQGITKIQNDEDVFTNGFVVEASEKNIYDAIDYIDTIKVESHTNIITALRTAISLSEIGKEANPQHEPIMFFLTDGDPNVVEVDHDVIIDEITESNSNVSCAIFSLVFGNDVSFKFLDALSKSNGGFAKMIYIAQDSSNQLTDFYKEISSPLMSNISLKYDPKLVDERTLTTTNFNNYFDGSELVVSGKISDGNTDRTVETRLDANYKPITESYAVFNVEKFNLDHSESSDYVDPLERLWAFMRVKQLLDEDLTKGKQNVTSKREVLALSLKYSFVTPLTSLVVVKPNETVYSKIESLTDKDKKTSTTFNYPPTTSYRPRTQKTSPPKWHIASLNEDETDRPSQPTTVSDNLTVETVTEASIVTTPIAIIANDHSTQKSIDLTSASSGLISNATVIAELARKPTEITTVIKSKYSTQKSETIKSNNSLRPLASMAPLARPNLFTVSLTVNQEKYASTTTTVPHLQQTSHVTQTSQKHKPNASLLTKYSIDDLTWLNRTKDKITIPYTEYIVDTSQEANLPHDPCISFNLTIKYCRHMRYCLFEDIVDDLIGYIPFRCFINKKYAGVCCPYEDSE